MVAVAFNSIVNVEGGRNQPAFQVLHAGPAALYTLIAAQR
jgi:hypothetical protein